MVNTCFDLIILIFSDELNNCLDSSNEKKKNFSTQQILPIGYIVIIVLERKDILLLLFIIHNQMLLLHVHILMQRIN